VWPCALSFVWGVFWGPCSFMLGAREGCTSSLKPGKPPVAADCNIIGQPSEEDTSEASGQTALPSLSDLAGGALRLELEELRLENARLRKLLEVTTTESKAARLAQAAIPEVMHHGPVTMDSSPEAKVRLFQDLFRARNDVYAVRWKNSRDGRSGWVSAVAGGGRKGANIASLAS
jgi:regulator of replication initiation timing